MTWRIFNSLPMVILFVLISAVTVFMVYQHAIDDEQRLSVLESKWIEEIGSSKCGAYSAYGTTNIELVSKELACRQVFNNHILVHCSMERDQWFSMFSSSSDGIKYRDCMVHQKVDL